MPPNPPPDEPDDAARSFGPARPKRLEPPPPIQHPGLAKAHPDAPPEEVARHSGVRILHPNAEASPDAEAPVAPVAPVPDAEFVDLPVGGDDDAAATTPVATPPEPVVAATGTRDSVLGVNIDRGVAFFAVVEPPAMPRMDAIEELRPDWEMDTREMVADFAERATSTLRDLDVGTIALVRPVRYTNWTYRSAFERVSLETCFLLAAHRLDLAYDSVGTNHAANTVGLPMKGLSDTLRTKLRIERSAGWPDRWPALLVAVAVLLERQHIELRDYAWERPRA
jgi:hypothetical protein